MPTTYLQQLAWDEAFPVDVTDEANIERLRILKAAGMIEVQLPNDKHSHALVMALTGKGRATVLADSASRVVAARSRQVHSALKGRLLA